MADRSILESLQLASYNRWAQEYKASLMPFEDVDCRSIDEAAQRIIMRAFRELRDFELTLAFIHQIEADNTDNAEKIYKMLIRIQQCFPQLPKLGGPIPEATISPEAAPLELMVKSLYSDYVIRRRALIPPAELSYPVNRMLNKIKLHPSLSKLGVNKPVATPASGPQFTQFINAWKELTSEQKTELIGAVFLERGYTLGVYIHPEWDAYAAKKAALQESVNKEEVEYYALQVLGVSQNGILFYGKEFVQALADAAEIDVNDLLHNLAYVEHMEPSEEKKKMNQIHVAFGDYTQTSSTPEEWTPEGIELYSKYLKALGTEVGKGGGKKKQRKRKTKRSRKAYRTRRR